MLSNRDEYVVAESVVVIKKLLQSQDTEHKRIITQMSKLLDFIAIPAARAAILWLIGEYNEKVPKIAPDVLRKLAKSFIDEQNVVKLQVLNLAVKLFLTNPKPVELICEYVFNLAKFDQNYDIRDRARFLRPFIFPTNKDSVFAKNAAKIFLATKPAPQLEQKFSGRDKYQLSSMSHYLNQRVAGYQPLPNFPEVAPDNTVRNLETPNGSGSGDTTVPQETFEKAAAKPKEKPSKGRNFYADPANDSSDSSSESSSESESEDENKSKKKSHKKACYINLDDFQ